jgi:hypothetical protein
MPVKTRQPAASTIRVRRTRVRKKIAALHGSAGWPQWPVRVFFDEHSLPITSWVKLSEIYDAPFSDRNIRIAELMPLADFEQLVRNEPAVESAWLRILTDDTLIVRPRYLGSEVLP